jgi:arginine/lysine/ornithine decarboxylase
MAGADIKIISPQYNTELDMFMPITVQDLKASFHEHPDIYAVYLTSPNYEGLSANYVEIKELC